MPNIAAVLKAEIARVARKEVRGEVESLRKSSTAQRSEIAGLRKRIKELERQLRAQGRATARAGQLKATHNSVDGRDGQDGGLRFRADGMAANRKRLGLSAADFGLLVGATGQSVYSWEQGKSKPRAKALAAIAQLRGLGKREVLRRLEMLKQ